MKRFLTLLSLLMLCIVGVNAQTSEQSEQGPITIYVQADKAPFIWMWNAANGQDLNVGDWPGQNQLTNKWTDPNTGDKFWTWTFPKEVLPISFLFNDGETSGTKQTKDINSVMTDRYFILSWDDGEGKVSFEDITENYLTVPDAEVTKVTLPGNHNSWDGSNQEFEVVEAGKTFKLTVDMTNIEVDNNRWQFKFRPNNQDWIGYWNIYYEGEEPIEGKVSEKEAPEFLSVSNDGNFMIDLEATEFRIFTITVTWSGGKDASKNWSFKMEAQSPGDATENDTWTIAGDMNMMGTLWDPTDTKNNMTSTDGVTYTLVKKSVMLKAGNYEYKVVKNHDWGEGMFPEENNAVLPIIENGEYKVTFTFNAETPELTAVAEKTGEYVAPVYYTVAGVRFLCGSSWDPMDKTNDMTSEDGVNYTLVKKNLVLEGDIPYEFKVCVNHSWDENYGSSEGGNAILTIAENGKYTVTFTFNAQTHEVGVGAVKTSDAVIAEKVWTIVGSTTLLGSGWDINDTTNDMTKLEDGTFQLVKKNVALKANAPYNYKIVANHDWDENYGAEGVISGNNAIFTVEENGIYDVTFTWNYETKELAATGQKTGEYTPVNQNFYVVGSFNNWTIYSDYQMTQQDNGLYSYTIKEIELEGNQAVEFKVCDYDPNEVFLYPAGANMVFAATQAGTYDITITFDPDKKEVTYNGERHVELHTYTVTWVNVGRWEQVYAYAWTYNIETIETTLFLGDYPGKLIELTGRKMIDGEEYDVYTCTIVDEFPPQNIIFNNGESGDGNQTTDYAFVDGREYSEIAPPVEITLNASGYMPYSSKYALSLTETMGVDAYYAAGVNENNELLFEQFLGKVPARYGLFLVGTPNSTVLIPTAFNVGIYPENLLKGSVENTSVQPSTNDLFRYIFLTSAESAGFYEVGAEGAISYANMAYIESPVKLATKENGEVKFVLSNSVVLKVNDILEKQIETSQIYNLQGQKLVKAQKGLNIINGKKCFVK